MARFAQCQPVIPLLRSIPHKTTIEQALARLQAEAENYPQRHRQLAAIRYYLQYMLWDCQENWRTDHNGITNYKTLLDQIEHWRIGLNEKVCLVTFNYDTMLEDALSEFLKIEFGSVESYVLGDHYLLLKLHGSVYWGREVDGITSPQSYNQNRLIDEAASLNVSARYRKIIDPRFVLSGEGRLVFPALAIPVENKSRFECPDEHVQVLSNVLPQVNTILTIGWRATESHFLALLRKCQPGAALMVVCNGSSEAGAVVDTLLNTGLTPRQGAVGEGGFSYVVTRGNVSDFLRKQI